MRKKKSSHELEIDCGRGKNMTYKKSKKNEEVLKHLKKRKRQSGDYGIYKIIRTHCAGWFAEPGSNDLKEIQVTQITISSW